jgi:hypothetical protein
LKRKIIIIFFLHFCLFRTGIWLWYLRPWKTVGQTGWRWSGTWQQQWYAQGCTSFVIYANS